MRYLGLWLALVSMSTGVKAADKPAPAYTSTLHVYASSGDWVGSQYGVKLTGTVDGQPVVLQTRETVNPILPGDYKLRVVRDRTLHQAEIDRKYAIALPDGTELTLDLIALCAKGSSVCYGNAIPATL